MKMLLKPAALKIYNKVACLWRPIFLDEGEAPSRWYGACRFAPFPYHNPPISPLTFRWQKIYYPIPLNVFLSWYWRLYFYVKRDCMLMPQQYSSKIFQVHTVCPECGHDLHKFPERFLVLEETKMQKNARMMYELIRGNYSEGELEKLLGLMEEVTGVKVSDL